MEISHSQSLQDVICELKRQIEIRDELSCKTCKGAGNVLIAADDGIDCPECAEIENEIRSGAIISLVNELAHNAVIDGISTIVIDVNAAIDYANKLNGDQS